ncbi:hypothetical protein VHEMI05294 [[Torrubiella] hemipterigena]|nr:hypothetical protein VHEMI05294 [[Torrubiella] hemipterigena]
MDISQKGPKACTTCAKAKARCIPGADGDKCERCQRLNKECFSRPPAPPRIKKRPKRSRVAELEKRLNELSSQVENAQPRGDQSPEAGVSDAPAAPANAAAAKDVLSFGHLFPSPEATLDSRDEPPKPSMWGTSAFDQLDSLWPMPEEAEVLFQEFRDIYEEVFPFVLLNRSLTSETLRDRRPYVWKAIMMVSCLFDATRQVRLAEKLLAEITIATMVDGTCKTLDVLQALHLLIGWYHYGLKGPQLTNLLFLSRSMCVGLGNNEHHHPACKYSDLDYARAIAATYYLNTTVFTTNKKTEIFMDTAQLEVCCKQIDAKKEFPSDVFLLSLVRIQLIAHNITLATSFDSNRRNPAIPLLQVVETFQQQIDTYLTSLPENLKNNTPILAHVYIAEILLKDVAISEQSCTTANIDITDRLQLLWSCVRSLRMFYQIRYAGRDLEKPRFLNLTASDVAFTLITSIKLLSVRLPGWELPQVKKELNLEEILSWLIEDLGLVVQKRQGGRRMSSAPAPIAEDPLVRLWRLLHNAKELVQIQLRRAVQNYGTEGEISPYMFGDLDESMWFDLMNEAAWGMGDESMPINVM